MVVPEGIDLDAAMRRVATEAKYDPVPDIINYQDYVTAWPQLRAGLEERLADESYLPAAPKIIEIAKTSLTTRPITVLQFVDRVYYEALVAKLTPILDEVRKDEVHSSRVEDLKRDMAPNRRGVKAWLRFTQASKKLSEERAEAFMLSTDISSYYEYVELPILLRELKDLPGVPPDVFDQLRKFLYRLVENPQSWGLPQNHTASGFIANLYLLPLDALIARTPGVQHVRYNDDIRVFGDDEAVLRKSLGECISLLRARHLNVATHKTRIVTSAELEAELTDDRKDAIVYGLEVDDDSVDEQLQEMFDTAVGGQSVDETDVAFALYRLQHLGDPYAVPWILEHLHEVPYLTSILVPYLRAFLGRDESIEPAIRGFLSDRSRNIYPHLEQHLVRLFARADHIDDDTYNYVWETLKDGTKAVYARTFAARCVARHVRPGDAAALQALLPEVGDHELRRAVVIALYESGGADRGVLNGIKNQYPALATTCDYLVKVARLPIP